MPEIDGTDYCPRCKCRTGNRVERQLDRTAFICTECGCETDACFDDDEYEDDEEDDEEDE